MKQQEHIMQEQATIRLRPIISYPREAKAGERYLFTIDVQLAEDSPWPYQEEEFEISFILETAPFFTYEPVGKHEPGLVLHRYGGTYGAAEYLLTASKKMVSPGKIKVTLLNGWGLPIAQLDLECEVKEDAEIGAKWVERTPPGQEQQSTQPPERPKERSEQQEDALLNSQEQRDMIARQLSMVGWDIRDADTLLEKADLLLNMNAIQLARATTKKMIVPPGNIALRGYYLLAENVYLLIIDREVVGFIKIYVEEKQLSEKVDSIALSDAIINTKTSNLKIIDFQVISGQLQSGIPFVYHTTGYETSFRSYLEPDIYSRNLYTFHQPVTLAAWLGEARKKPSDLLRARLLRMPALEQGNLFDYQYEALQHIEQSLAEGYSRTLIQLETGRGKTHIAMRSVYRLLAHANARRILYIVDIPAAKQYAFDAFKRYIIDSTSLFDKTSFTDRYEVEIISNEKLDPSVPVYIGTLEDLYTLYASGRGRQNLPPPIHNNPSVSMPSSVKDYNTDLPIEYFDAIILAESEHLDYQFWQPVLDYFDTFYIGILSSVSDEVLRFFNTHLVYPTVESHEAMRDEQNSSVILTSQKLVTLMESVRDLLKTDTGLSDDTDLLSQLTWLLLLKYLDDFELAQEALSSDSYIPIIEPGYRWRDWASVESPTHRRKGDELLTFVNTDLIPYLGRLSGTNARDIRPIIATIFRGISNRIHSGSILGEVVDRLNNINFNTSDDMHMIIPYYEAMLKDMRDSAGKNGEFYTPRPIVRFIIDCLKPRLGESLLDPACGTGGFLVETYGRLVGHVRTPEQQRQLQDYLIGIEKMPGTYLLATMNMLLHGIETPTIINSDALATNFHWVQDNDYVDIIATVPPINQKEKSAIPYNFSEDIRTTNTNTLYVQLIMNTLKRPGGRCGIIASNDFLSKKGVASLIKHRLLTHFTLHTIVRLPPGVFSSYTNIPTNILFFEATEYLNSLGRVSSTQEVWYYEIPLPKGQDTYTKAKPIQYEAFHDCILWWEHREENEHAWKVPVEELFANDCNLDRKKPRRTEKG